MDDTVFMEMNECVDGLADIVSSFTFGKESFLSQDVE